MSGEQRLNKLYPALTAKERAVLVLHSYKDCREEDPLIRRTMPWEQTREFLRLVRLMNAVNVELACVIFILREQVTQLDLKYAWLQTLHLWGVETAVLGQYIAKHTRPPRKPGSREERRDIQLLLKRPPAVDVLPYDLERPLCAQVSSEDYGGELARTLVVGVRDGLRERWRELRSVEIAIEDVVEEFGEDPLRADARALLDSAKGVVLELQKNLEPYAGEIELLEPREEELALARKLVERAAA